MPYKITIQKRETNTKMVRGDWVKLHEREDDCFGYAPDREKEVEDVRDVYEQTVEDIDMVKVIKAVNSIGE